MNGVDPQAWRRSLTHRRASVSSARRIAALELVAPCRSHPCSRCLIKHINKVSHVTTINKVAADLGENEDWLYDVACEMETEDGVIWVRGLGEDVLMAFTDFGVETLIELIKIYKDGPTLLRLLCRGVSNFADARQAGRCA
jgi:hypothetical protein